MASRRILIVEDDILTSKHIETVLKKFGYEIAGVCNRVEAAMRVLKEQTPDLVILDINLNELIDGVQLASMINLDYQIPFIYLTSYTDEATLERIRQTNPYGYIVKPFNKFELRNVIELAFDRLDREVNVSKEKTTTTTESIDEYIFIKTNKVIEKVKIDNVLVVEADGKYVLIHTEKKKYIANSSFKEMQSKFDSDKFIQVHRSYLVNFTRIDSFTLKSICVAEKEIPIGRAYKDNIHQKLNLL